jgi:transposase
VAVKNCTNTVNEDGTLLRNGKKVWYRVQRFHCPNCGATFTLLLPNMLPHKHYAAIAIEEVIEHDEDPSAKSPGCEAEESTLRKWKQEFPAKIISLAVKLEKGVNAAVTSLLPPLQRLFKALALASVQPPPGESRLAWGFFINERINSSHPVCIV